MKLLVRSMLLLAPVVLGACSSPETRARPVEPAAEVFGHFPLQHAVAMDVAAALRQLCPEARVFADPRTNSVLVTCASETELRQVSECVARLDVQVR